VVDEDSITSCIDGVVADHGSLDVLVNNAGRGFVGTIEQVSMDEMRAVMEVNFFGVVATTKAALPHLRASGGRVITVTSVGGVVGQPFNEAYCAAKFAVEGFMESLAPVAATVGVHVSVIEPGPVSTEFVNNVGVDVAKMFAEGGEYTPAMKAYMGHIMAEFANPDAAQTGDDVAETVLTAMVTDSAAFRHQTSPWARTFTGFKLSDHDGSAVVGMTSDWVK
jgi:NAD(P)-dependent dehydrogenase (short-subunit alcohol dehydrogenase family)